MKRIVSKILVIATIALGAVSCTKECNYYYTYNTQVDSIYTSNYYQTVLAEQQEITENIRPAYLKAGDTIAVFAISNFVTKSEIENGIAVLKSWGLNVIEADNLYNQNGRYAGTEAERIEGFQKLINDKSIKALISARGGYGAAQVLSFIDFSPLKTTPKWIVGYSDVTATHIAINNLGIESIHGLMVIKMSDNESVESLRKALFGELTNYSIATNSNCVEGTAEGRLVGGNLSLIYSLGGTLFDLNVKDAILFIEDTDEPNYAIDRMLINLKLSGKLDAIKGVVVGEFTRTTQASDKSIEEIIADHFGNLDIPIMYGAKMGHDTKNIATVLGRTVKLEVNSNTATITY